MSLRTSIFHTIQGMEGDLFTIQQPEPNYGIHLLYNVMFNQLLQQNPPGAEYNVPLGQIRPGQNEVNINSGMGGPEDAFAAYSRLTMPYLQNQNQMLMENWKTSANAMGPAGADARYRQMVQDYGGGFDPMQTSPQDYQTALGSMFQQKEDARTMRNYFGPKYSGFPY